MTHVQKYWKYDPKSKNLYGIRPELLEKIKSWMTKNPSIPEFVTTEQIILFIHACFGDVENTKNCMESYYRLRKEATQFFEARDIQSPDLRKALKVLYYGILPEKTPDGSRIIFHMLRDTKPAHFVFHDGFKLLMMTIDAVNLKEGPQDGIIMLFDMKGVKLAHLLRLPIFSVRKSLEFIQDAIPVRIKSIHVLNVNSLIDKIMFMVKPFLREKFLALLHFHRPNDKNIFETFPANCLPKNYGGELETIDYYHNKFIEEMESINHLFLEETHLFETHLNFNKNT